MRHGVSLEVFKLWVSAPCGGCSLERNGTLDGITPESKGQQHNSERVYLSEFRGHFCKGVFPLFFFLFRFVLFCF